MKLNRVDWKQLSLDVLMTIELWLQKPSAFVFRLKQVFSRDKLAHGGKDKLAVA